MPSLDTNSVSGLRSSSFVTFDSGWVRKTCGSFWKMAATVANNVPVVTVERHQGVGGHEEVELACDQQHAVVVVWPARHDGDVEPVFPVGAVGHGLEKSAVLGLGNPVGSERNLVQRLGTYRHDGHQNRHQGKC